MVWFSQRAMSRQMIAVACAVSGSPSHLSCLYASELNINFAMALQKNNESQTARKKPNTPITAVHHPLSSLSPKAMLTTRPVSSA